MHGGEERRRRDRGGGAGGRAACTRKQGARGTLEHGLRLSLLSGCGGGLGRLLDGCRGRRRVGGRGRGSGVRRERRRDWRAVGCSAHKARGVAVLKPAQGASRASVGAKDEKQSPIIPLGKICGLAGRCTLLGWADLVAPRADLGTYSQNTAKLATETVLGDDWRVSRSNWTAGSTRGAPEEQVGLWLASDWQRALVTGSFSCSDGAAASRGGARAARQSAGSVIERTLGPSRSKPPDLFASRDDLLVSPRAPPVPARLPPCPTSCTTPGTKA